MPLSADVTRLVGRDRELDQLRAILEAGAGGVGQTIFVLGDAGIGKTALAEAAVAAAHAQGYWVVRGRVWPLDAGLAYAPIAAAVGPWLRGLDGELRGRLIEGLPELSRLLGDLGLAQAMPLGDPALEKTRLFEAMARLLERAAEDTPTLVFLDDLHHADHGTVELLHYLMRRLDAVPFVLLATARSGAGRRPLVELIGHAQLSGLARSIELGPLDEDGLRRLTDAALGGRADDELLALLAERAGGAPFFTLALLRTLRREHKLIEVRDRWRLASGARHALPPEVRQLVLARLDALEPSRRTTLEHLAVGGTPVRLGELAGVCDLDRGQLVEALEELCRRGAIAEERADDGAVTYTLAHPLGQEVVLEQLSAPRRKEIHGRYLRALGARGASPSLAWHVRGVLPEVDDPARAFEILLAAGREAMETGAFEDAITWLEPAVALARRHQPGDQLAAALDALGASRVASLDLGGATAAWTEALELLDGRDVEAAAGLRGRLAVTLWELGHLDTSVATLREGVARLEEGGPSAALARLYQYCFVIGWRTGDAAWLEATAEALESWSPVPDALAFAVAIAKIHRFIAEGRFAEGMDVALSAVELAATPTDAFMANRALLGLASLLSDRAASEAALRRCADSGVAAWMGPPASTIRGSQYLREGNLPKAVDHLREAVVEAGLPGMPRRLAMAGAMLAVPLALQGRADEARAELDEATARLADHLHDVHVRGELDTGELVLAMELGDHESAGARARAMISHAWGLLHGWFQALALLQAGDLEGAAERADALASHFGDVPFAAAGERRVAGLIWAARGEPAKAARALDQALELVGDPDQSFFAAQIALERAEVLVSTRRKKSEAISDGQRALATFEQNGAGRYAERARKLLRELGQKVTAPRRSAAGPLSARELEVARLAAAGNTNAAIGEALFISPHTAATHIKNIYARTGVRNRAALGEWLRANDLI